MRRLETQRLESFNTTEIDEPAVFEVQVHDGQELSYEALTGNTPAITSSYDGFRNRQTVLAENEGLPHWDSDTYFPAGRLASIHGRSLEVLADRASIFDRYGNEYQSINIKGSDFTNPHFYRSATAEREYIIYGLQESIVMERVLRASRLLREHGVGTEYIFSLALPESFPIDIDEQEVDVKKPKELPEFLEHLAAKFAQDTSRSDGEDLLQVKTDMIERFSDCDYLVSYRAMDCPYRFGELSSFVMYQQFAQFIVRNNDEIGITEYFEDAVIFEHIKNEVAPNLAANLAKMHSLGLVHGFLHGNNITALGSIVDLDSCRGEALGLGDEAVTDRQQAMDVLTCLKSIENVYQKMLNNYYRDSSADTVTAVQTLMHQSSLDFLNNYLHERFETLEQKIAYLAEALLHIEEVANSNDSMSVVQLAQRIFDSYEMISGPHTNAIVDSPLPTLPSPEVLRGDTFLKALPASLFDEIRPYILDYLTLEKEHDQSDDDKLPNHMLWFTVKNIYLKKIIAAYKNEPDFIPESLLSTVGFILEKHTIPDSSEDSRPTRYRTTLNEYGVALVDELKGSEDGIDNFVQAPVDRFILDTFPSLREQLGQVSISKKEVPTLYLKDNNQYAQVITTIWSEGPPPRVEFIAPDELTDYLTDPTDSLVVSDYRVALRLTELRHQTDMSWRVLQHYPTNRPTIIVRDILKGEPYIQVIYKPDATSTSSSSHFHKLLELVVPGAFQKAQPELEGILGVEAPDPNPR